MNVVADYSYRDGDLVAFDAAGPRGTLIDVDAHSAGRSIRASRGSSDDAEG